MTLFTKPTDDGDAEEKRKLKTRQKRCETYDETLLYRTGNTIPSHCRFLAVASLYGVTGGVNIQDMSHSEPNQASNSTILGRRCAWCLQYRKVLSAVPGRQNVYTERSQRHSTPALLGR